MTDFPQTRPRTDALRTVLEVAVVVLFALLIWKNYALRRQARAAAVPSGRQHAFVARDAIASIPIVDLAGKPGVLDLQSGRTTIAVVDPGCDSCQELIGTLRGASGVRVLSVAPADETRKLAEQSGLGNAVSALGQPLPKPIAPQLQIYPQLFIVDHGKVVRTCASWSECR
jgi:hypothetical protein